MLFEVARQHQIIKSFPIVLPEASDLFREPWKVLRQNLPPIRIGPRRDEAVVRG